MSVDECILDRYDERILRVLKGVLADGANISMLHRVTGISRETIKKHLLKLQRCGYVVSEKVGREVLWKVARSEPQRASEVNPLRVFKVLIGLIGCGAVSDSYEILSRVAKLHEVNRSIEKVFGKAMDIDELEECIRYLEKENVVESLPTTLGSEGSEQGYVLVAEHSGGPYILEILRKFKIYAKELGEKEARKKVAEEIVKKISESPRIKRVLSGNTLEDLAKNLSKKIGDIWSRIIDVLAENIEGL